MGADTKQDEQPKPYIVIGHPVELDLPKVAELPTISGISNCPLKTADLEAAREMPPRLLLVQAWGAVGVAAYLSYGVRKVVPIVLSGLGEVQTPLHWGVLAVTLLFFAYVEGYKNFQHKFAPRVVCRAWIVAEASSSAPLWHKVLAPAFCIGYFHGTMRRVISSWAITSIIFFVVIGVRHLPNPYRAIVDAGVIVGLGWGVVAVLVLFFRSLWSKLPPEFDPALPESSPYTPPPPVAM